MADVYLTLDLATKTGFALWKPGSLPLLGTFTMPSANGDVGHSFAKFRDWLLPFMKFSGVTHMMYEAAYLKPDSVIYTNGRQIRKNGTSQNVARVLFGLGGYAETLCFDEGIRYNECMVSQWRTHLLGHNPERSVAHRETRQELAARGIPETQQDKADAMGLMIYMAHALKLDPDWPVGRHRGTAFDMRNKSPLLGHNSRNFA